LGGDTEHFKKGGKRASEGNGSAENVRKEGRQEKGEGKERNIPIQKP
jgi:hypothetical protein